MEQQNRVLRKRGGIIGASGVIIGDYRNDIESSIEMKGTGFKLGRIRGIFRSNNCMD